MVATLCVQLKEMRTWNTRVVFLVYLKNSPQLWYADPTTQLFISIFQQRWILFYMLCICEVGGVMHVNAVAWRSQKKMLDSLELEWGRHLMWMLGIEFKFSAVLLTTKLSPQTLYSSFKHQDEGTWCLPDSASFLSMLLEGPAIGVILVIHRTLLIREIRVKHYADRVTGS